MLFNFEMVYIFYVSAILLFIGLYGTFAFYNSRLKTEIAQQSQRNISFLMLAIAHLVVTIFFFYCLYDGMKLYLRLVNMQFSQYLLLPYSPNSLI